MPRHPDHFVMDADLVNALVASEDPTLREVEANATRAACSYMETLKGQARACGLTEVPGFRIRINGVDREAPPLKAFGSVPEIG